MEKKKLDVSYGEWIYQDGDNLTLIEKLLLTEKRNIPEDYKIFRSNNDLNDLANIFITADTDRFSAHKKEYL